jgi:hypothetical protein
MPAGLDATSSTSRQLRSGLRRLGWGMQETPTEVRLIKPGAAATEVTEVLGSPDEQVVGDETEPYFSLEYQLRDFIASNIGTVVVNGSRLRLFVDPIGRDGIEYPTAVGLIDILAVDDSGAFYVFELKRANRLGHFPGLGHRGAVLGTYEWIVPQLPYIIVYEFIGGNRVVVLGIFHAAQDR